MRPETATHPPEAHEKVTPTPAQCMVIMETNQKLPKQNVYLISIP